MRLFVAIELDERAEAMLADCQQSLEQLDRLIKWVRPEQMHLTLKFLGEVPDAQVPAIGQALESLAVHPAIEFEIAGAGFFGSPGSPKVLWVGLDEPTGRLADLHKACQTALAALGFALESRPFKPHLTLGRVRPGRGSRQISEAIQQIDSEGVGPIQQVAHGLVLFESRLRPQGPEYIRVHGVMLRGG